MLVYAKINKPFQFYVVKNYTIDFFFDRKTILRAKRTLLIHLVQETALGRSVVKPCEG